ncbi:sodium- and chloride-dependent neutral and basic amino acid transporter B(0+)-like [Heptranchias perlo]|uniref:sodium- and chloride-dependent neutral and basic amino acid transporter B(0+)-like n=1 Tax=Heptranchias perlo TaxID=212740 RepID=UPI00355A3365
MVKDFGVEREVGDGVIVFKDGDDDDFQEDDDDFQEITDENVERGNWSLKLDYLLSMIGYTVGLGNVWRFPFLVYKNGGGVFLIPYMLMLAFAGMPMFFLECSLGQFASLGPIQVWKAVPVLQGVGIVTVVVSIFQSIYYNCIIAYSLYYFFASFQSPLPWAECYSRWDTNEICKKNPKDPICNFTLSPGHYNRVSNKTCTNGLLQQSPSEHYWDTVVLRRSTSINETGEIVWHLALCLLLAWLIVSAVMCKGIKSSGKVVYFTATFPYMVLTTFLIRGLTLEGAYKGIEYFIGIQSDFSKLAHAEIWKDAATQIFYSLSVSLGGITTLSSYNKFHNNSYADTIFICVVNCATSMFAGFVVFSILGHIAGDQEILISEVSDSGLGLIFIAFSEAFLHLPVSPFWSILFFGMLVTLGLDSQFALIETIITSLQDEFPTILRTKRFHLTVTISLALYFCGLLLVTKAGIYWTNLIDHFCSGWGLLLVALVELIDLSWIYGMNRFIKDIEMMIGQRNCLFWLWWRSCWFFITPCLLATILIWSLITFAPPTYGPVEYPVWATVLGWCMIIFCIMWIPIVAIVKIAQTEGPTLCQKFVAYFKPPPDWGPFLLQHRGERYKDQIDPLERLNSSFISSIFVSKFKH